ncbi:hypothetical protein MRX96_047437 [Rhipicephalus microplus]
MLLVCACACFPQDGRTVLGMHACFVAVRGELQGRSLGWARKRRCVRAAKKMISWLAELGQKDAEARGGIRLRTAMRVLRDPRMSA